MDVAKRYVRHLELDGLISLRIESVQVDSFMSLQKTSGVITYVEVNLASKRKELNAAEEACAQHMSLAVVARLGSRLAAKDVGCCASLLWKWSRGRSSPTKAKFRDLQAVYERLRGEK